METDGKRMGEQERLQAYVIDPVFEVVQPLPGWWLDGEPRWLGDIGEFLGITGDDAMETLAEIL